MISTVALIAIIAIRVFVVMLIVRGLISWAQTIWVAWTPHGLVLVLLEALYSITDPPLRLFRRLIPPKRFASTTWDFGFVALFFLCQGLIYLLGYLR